MRIKDNNNFKASIISKQILNLTKLQQSEKVVYYFSSMRKKVYFFF